MRSVHIVILNGRSEYLCEELKEFPGHQLLGHEIQDALKDLYPRINERAAQKRCRGIGEAVGCPLDLFLVGLRGDADDDPRGFLGVPHK